MGTMMRALALAALTALAGCLAVEKASDPVEVADVAYRDPAPASLTLVTVINEVSGRGGHSALIVNASQRVVFDPAGTFNDGLVRPERGDVIYGMDPRYLQAYLDYHVRRAWRTHTHTVEVPPAVAEEALRRVQAYGAVAKAHCGKAVSDVLADLPGLPGLYRGFYPRPLMNSFAAIPGARERVYRHTDPGLSAAQVLPQG